MKFLFLLNLLVQWLTSYKKQELLILETILCVYVCAGASMKYRTEVDVLMWYLELHRLIKPPFSVLKFFFSSYISLVVWNSPFRPG